MLWANNDRSYIYTHAQTVAETRNEITAKHRSQIGNCTRRFLTGHPYPVPTPYIWTRRYISFARADSLLFFFSFAYTVTLIQVRIPLPWFRPIWTQQVDGIDRVRCRLQTFHTFISCDPMKVLSRVRLLLHGQLLFDADAKTRPSSSRRQTTTIYAKKPVFVEFHNVRFNV